MAERAWAVTAERPFEHRPGRWGRVRGYLLIPNEARASEDDALVRRAGRSFYTHITDHWPGWLLEHHRVLSSGGLLFASVLGEGMIQLTGETWDDRKIGLNPLMCGNPWDLGGPIVLMSPWWLRAHWGRAFDIVELRPWTGSGPPEGHGLVLLRKEPVEVTPEDLTRFEPGEPREITPLQHHVVQLQREILHLRAQLTGAEASTDGTDATSLRRLPPVEQEREQAARELRSLRAERDTLLAQIEQVERRKEEELNYAHEVIHEMQRTRVWRVGAMYWRLRDRFPRR